MVSCLAPLYIIALVMLLLLYFVIGRSLLLLPLRGGEQGTADERVNCRAAAMIMMIEAGVVLFIQFCLSFQFISINVVFVLLLVVVAAGTEYIMKLQ